MGTIIVKLGRIVQASFNYPVGGTTNGDGVLSKDEVTALLQKYQATMTSSQADATGTQTDSSSPALNVVL